MTACRIRWEREESTHVEEMRPNQAKSYANDTCRLQVRITRTLAKVPSEQNWQIEKYR